MTDSELIIMLKNDPSRGLAEVVDKYSGYVYKIAYSKLSGVCRREDIEEAASDIFMKFYEYITTTDKPVNVVAPYLAVIAKRHSINLYKKHTSETEVVSFEEIGDTVAFETDDSYTRQRLIEAIVALGRPDSEIFMRKYFYGQKSRDIAEELGMKTNTVDKTVSRGLVKLRKILNEQEGA